MGVVAFLMLAGVAVGSIALHSGAEAIMGVLLGALGAVLIDAAGLWRQGRRTRRLAQTTPGPVALAAPPARQLAVAPGRVLCLILRDTFELSVVIIALVGGVTYAVVATFAWSLHLLAE